MFGTFFLLITPHVLKLTKEETFELGVGDLAITGLVHHGETLLEHLFCKGLDLNAVFFLVVGPFLVKVSNKFSAL